MLCYLALLAHSNHPKHTMAHSMIDDRPDLGFVTLRQILARATAKWSKRIYSQRRNPDSTWTRYTYADLHNCAREIGTALHRMGYQKGAHIALLSENRPEWPLIFLSIVNAGFVVIPIDALLKPAEIESILLRSKAGMLFFSERFTDTVKGISPNLPELQETVSVDNVGGTITLSALRQIGQQALAEGNKYVDELQINPEDLAEIIFTSGTTGASKGVMLEHQNLARNACLNHRVFAYYDYDRFLSVLPLHHAFETTGGMIGPLLEGCTITYVRSLKSRDITEDMQSSDSTVMLGVPLLFEKIKEGVMRGLREKTIPIRIFIGLMFFLTRLTRLLGWRDSGRFFLAPLRRAAGMHSMKKMISGAAPISPRVIRWFWTMGFHIFHGYGLTETSPVVSGNRLDALDYDSVGLPLPDLEVRIARADSNGVGEIQVKGQTVMRGYFEDEEATKESLDREGWFSTGDSGYFDRRGFLHISGRVKSVIVSAAGKNIYPEEVETLLNQSPLILESVVLGSKMVNSNREDVCAIIVPDMEAIRKQLEEHQSQSGGLEEPLLLEIIWREVRRICEHMAEYKRVKKLKLRMEELPKTSTRKVKRYLFGGERF